VSQQDVENAQAGFALINEAYRRHDVEVLRPHLERVCHPDLVFEPAGVLPESVGTRHGIDGMLDFMAEQMKAFADGSMRMTPLEFIDLGDRLVVPYRFGGRARYTGLDVEFEFVHVYTVRDGLTMRVDVLPDKAAAFAKVGYPGSDSAARSASPGSM
jgi:ketosteroid isomerase-like protein